MDKQFIPVAACVVAIFLLLLVRPSFLVNSSNDKECPYCLNKWLVSAVVLAIGSVAFVYVNQGAERPSVKLY